MKGISLPLETVVLLILAAIVLAALLGFFLGTFTPAQSEADLSRKQFLICQEIASKDPTCNPNNPVVTALVERMKNEKICRADRPACRLEPGQDQIKSCINNCCQAFCPRIS
ncbi:MAG: hypothetical protein QW548_02620 [Candidatus Aenigmatarchaeota archaeon]